MKKTWKSVVAKDLAVLAVFGGSIAYQYISLGEMKLLHIVGLIAFACGTVLDYTIHK